VKQATLGKFVTNIMVANSTKNGRRWQTL